MRLKTERPDYASIEDRRKGPIVEGRNKTDRLDTQRSTDYLKVAREDKAKTLQEEAGIRSALRALRDMGYQKRMDIAIGGIKAQYKRNKKKAK
jgi:hypothetical protein